MKDDIADVLAARAPIPPPDKLRQAILARTSAVVRRRRVVRRLTAVAAVIVVYVVGVISARWIPTPLEGDAPIASKDAAVPNPETPAAEIAAISPLTMEWQAIDNPNGRAARFRQAGDRYLALGDIESALRCYRNALAMGSAEDAVIRPDDSWLLMSLKHAKLKEKNHVSFDG